jgi:phage terminase large subunit-like protein
MMVKVDERLEARKWRERTGKLMRVKFPPKIWAFINSTSQAAYLRGPNSGGKSYAMAFFLAQILLGRYHPEYTGWKPTMPANDTYSVIVWCLSKSAQVLRDAMQTHMLALLPPESIVRTVAGRGIGGTVDFIEVRRDDGTLAKLSFKSYEQGREAMQGERVTVVAADEMFDDPGMLAELLARGAGVNGIFRLSATERLQQSAVAQWFYDGEGEHRIIYSFGMDDVERLSIEERARIKASYPVSEVESRYYGLSFRGGGQVMYVPIEDALVTVDPTTFGPQCKYLISIDPSHFGQSEQSSKFAALFWMTDPFVPGQWTIFREVLMRGGINDHVGALLAAGAEGIPIAYPHDGTQGQSTGDTLAGLFKSFPGIRMHSHHATFGPGTDGGYNREDGIEKANKLFSDGLIKISKSCPNLVAQYQGYERGEDGKPVARNDDLMSALRVGVMMLRIARGSDAYANRANSVAAFATFGEGPGSLNIYTGLPNTEDYYA